MLHANESLVHHVLVRLEGGRPARTFVGLSVSVPLVGNPDLSVPRDFLIPFGGATGMEDKDEDEDVEEASDFIGGGEFMVMVSSCSSAWLMASASSSAAEPVSASRAGSSEMG